MPTVLTRILIASFWLICTGMLIYRDVLPEYLVGEPPDWKRMVNKPETRPTRWLIAVDEGGEKNRVIGQAFNEIKKRADGGTSFTSRVKIDAKGLFQGTPLQVAESTKFQFVNTTNVTPQGLLDQIKAEVLVEELGEKPILVIQGMPTNQNKLDIRFSSSISPLLNFRQLIDYAPKDMVRGGLEPIDQLPGLRIGQRWTTQILQPMTARPDSIKSEVIALSRIFWNGNPTEVLIVEHKASTFSAKTWVRRDGLVLRQQLPTPLVKLVLERDPEREN